jgi:two-component SAPR family response regulator
MFTAIGSAPKVSLDALRECAGNHRLILLYPWSQYRDEWLHKWVNHVQDECVYFRVAERVKTLREFLRDFAQEMEHHFSGFTSAVQGISSEPSAFAMGEATAYALNHAAQGGRFLLLIDENTSFFAQADTARYFSGMLSRLDPCVTVIISARFAHYPQWQEVYQTQPTAIIANARQRHSLSFALESQAKPQLEVSAFGKGSAYINTQEIVNWDGTLPRSLFYYFMDHQLVTRDEIFADFWSSASVKEATDIFHVTKHKVGEVINRRVRNTQIKTEVELTQYKQGFYIPADSMCRHYDVEQFMNAVERAEIATNEREIEALLRRALDLYKGTFLMGLEVSWVVARREQLAHHFSEVLIRLARLSAQRGDFEEAIKFYRRALEIRPDREDIHRDIMRIFLQLGRSSEARDQYSVLDQQVYQRLGIAPSPQSVDLLRELQA